MCGRGGELATELETLVDGFIVFPLSFMYTKGQSSSDSNFTSKMDLRSEPAIRLRVTQVVANVHPVVIAFVVTINKLQGKSKHKVILSLSTRGFLPPITLAGVYVALTRVFAGRAGIRLLPPEHGSTFDHLCALERTTDLMVWSAGFDECGVWDADKAREELMRLQGQDEQLKAAMRKNAAATSRLTYKAKSKVRKPRASAQSKVAKATRKYNGVVPSKVSTATTPHKRTVGTRNGGEPSTPSPTRPPPSSRDLARSYDLERIPRFPILSPVASPPTCREKRTIHTRRRQDPCTPTPPRAAPAQNRHHEFAEAVPRMADLGEMEPPVAATESSAAHEAIAVRDERKAIFIRRLGRAMQAEHTEQMHVRTREGFPVPKDGMRVHVRGLSMGSSYHD